MRTRSGKAVLAVALVATLRSSAMAEVPHAGGGRDANHWLPALEIVGLNLAMNGVARLQGAQFAKISLGSVADNLGGRWEWDRDAFLVNQFRHPYMGAAFFSAARSSGVGFWGSAGYAFMGSLMWELMMETERPAINDQVSTTIGGIVLGEAQHRLANALLWHSSSWWRRGLAAMTDPVGSFNRYVLGARPMTRPGRLFSYAGVGYGAAGELSQIMGSSHARMFRQLHLVLAATYGLPGDRRFVPRAPMEHLDLVGQLDVSDGNVVGAVFVRALLSGRRYTRGNTSGVWGAFATYDFFNPDRHRVSAVGLGIGTSLQLRLGRKGFVETTGLVSVVPLGAAGITESPGRNYSWGPGASQLIELRLGRADTGLLKLSTRGFEIFGGIIDDGSELINHTAVTGLLKLKGRHAVGAELTGSVRRATFAEPRLDSRDSAGQLRIFYALLSSTSFGRGR